MADPADGAAAMGHEWTPETIANRRNLGATLRVAVAPVPQNTDAGNRYLPVASAANYGAQHAGQASPSNLYGQFFVGPYNIGAALRAGAVMAVPTETYIGAAVNVVVLGWILNMVTDRKSPLDMFGIVVAAATQIGFGVAFTPLPTTALAAAK